MNFYLTALGCKLNQAEIEGLARAIEARGQHVVPDPAEADWAIVNSCTVTHIAARKSRQLVRQLHKANAALRVALIGCYATISPAQASDLEGVALVLSNADKEQVIERILALDLPDDSAATGGPLASFGPHPGRTRALVKIQDGCDNRCTYCIVTVARGPQRSRLPAEILREARLLLAEGYREIVLTGVNIGAYGQDRHSDPPLPAEAGWSLARLARLLLEETEVERLRFSSIEPWDVTPELLELWRDKRAFGGRVCRHLHIPLQSGCGATLRRMARRYTPEEFAALVDDIRRQIPGVSLTTDVIVGFPGESEVEFAESVAFVERMRFSRLHVFRYSRRTGTVADRLPDQVPPPVAQARSDHLMALGERMARAFHERFVWCEVEVLFESSQVEGDMCLWNGLTDNYLRVTVPSCQKLANTLARVRCASADASGLTGELVSGASPAIARVIHTL